MSGSFSRKVRCLAVLGMLGCWLPSAVRADETAALERFAARTGDSFPISIEAFANVEFDQDVGGYEGNNLKSLPRGPQLLGDVAFDIGRRYIMLAGKRVPDLPEKASGIAVGAQASHLHFLHATNWGSPGLADGTRIGAYVVHYADGTDSEIPILYGRSLRDWWALGEDRSARDAKVVWRGVNDASRAYRGQRVEIRLFRLDWQNPAPEKTIAAIDFVSTNDSMCSPFLVAISGSRAALTPKEAERVLQAYGAKLEFNASQEVIAAWIAGPGPIAGVTRGSDEAARLLASLPQLERAYLNYRDITDRGVDSVTKCPSIKWLSLNFSSVTDAGLAYVASARQLERLRLHATRITDEGLKSLSELSELEVLDLSNTAVTDSGLDFLQGLAQLKELDVRDTAVTEAGINRLLATHPDLDVKR